MPREITYESSRTMTSHLGKAPTDRLGYGIECPRCRAGSGLLEVNANAVLLLREKEQHELVDFHIGLDSVTRCKRCRLTGTRRSFTQSWCALMYTSLCSEREMNLYMPAGFVAALLQRPHPSEWAHGFLVTSEDSSMLSYSWRPIVPLRGERDGEAIRVEVGECDKWGLDGGLVTFPGNEFLSSLEEMGYL